MTDHRAGIIFSDLDGTFLDERYEPVLDAARFARVTARWHVVWVSSRTADELLHVQRRLGHEEDAIGENGGVVLSRTHAVAQAFGATEAVGDAWVARSAPAHDATAARVRAVFADAGLPVCMLEDLSADEFARRSNCSAADAMRAQRRRASVLLADIDPDHPRVRAALAALRRDGHSVAHGGRWTSVVQATDKGTTARAWLARAPHVATGAARLVAAIGNSENDASLLAMADHPFVIRDPVTGYATGLTSVTSAHRLRRPGTAGWIEMLEAVDRIAQRAT